MANDLVRILKETEKSLSDQPKQYLTHLEMFMGQDERILAEFLTGEKNEKSHYRRHEKWSALIGQPQKYSHPKKYMKKLRDEFPKVEAQMREVALNDKLIDMGVSQEVMSVWGDVPNMLYRFMDMQTMMYESIVAYAKQIGDEQGKKPVDIVSKPENRDEIYRRIFKTREQFEWYNNTAAQLTVTVLGAYYKMMEVFRPKLKEIERIPFLGWLLTRKIHKSMDRIPPKPISESFLRDEIAYDRRQAERIYGNSYTDFRIVDAEIVQ